MKLIRISLVVAAVAGLFIAHVAGYKIYGSATVHDNGPVLDSPRELASLAAPNVVIATDGTRFKLPGFTFAPYLLDLPVDDLRQVLTRRREPVLIQPDPGSPSGVVFQRPLRYTCGNTWDPQFLPERLPRYDRTDLGGYFTSYELATDTNSH